MAELDMKDAMVLAESLITIGHPRQAGSVMATAMDLHDWCKGTIFEGRPWTPLEQATALVQEVRLTWEDGWPEKGGTRKLYALFRAKYAPTQWKPLSYDQTVAKGLIRPPCAACDDGFYLGKPPNMSYCLACPGGRRHAQWNGDQALHVLNREGANVGERRLAPPSPLAGLNLDQVLRDGQAVFEDEQRRKREQLEKLDGGE